MTAGMINVDNCDCSFELERERDTCKAVNKLEVDTMRCRVATRPIA